MSVEGIGIVAALVLVGLALASMVLFGVRNLFYGKQEWTSIAFGIIPVAVFGGLAASGMTWAVSGIWTTLVMLALGALGLFVSSVRGLLGL
jgi:hypothetical protein